MLQAASATRYPARTDERDTNEADRRVRARVATAPALPRSWATVVRVLLTLPKNHSSRACCQTLRSIVHRRTSQRADRWKRDPCLSVVYKRSPPHEASTRSHED